MFNLEIQRLIDNLNEYSEIDTNEEVIDLFEELHEFPFDELIYFEDPLHVENLETQKIISQIDYSLDFLMYNKNIEINNDVISIVKTTIVLFKRAFSQIDLKYFIFFSYLNSYLKLDINHIIKKFNYESNLKMMENKITELFKEIQVYSKPNIILNEKNSHTHLQNISFKSLKKDEIINAILTLLNIGEDPLIFHHFKVYGPKLITCLISHIKKMDYNFFLTTMFELDNLIMAVLFSKELTLHEIFECFYENNTQNIDVLFTFLKKTFDSDELKWEHYIFIKDIMFNILDLDVEVLKKIINLFKHEESLNIALGLLIYEINKETMELLINEFDLNIFANDDLIQLRENLLINVNEKSENYKSMLEIVFNNWNSHLNLLLDDDKQGLDLLVSDFNSFILEYYRKFYDKQKLINEMKLYFNKLEKIDTIWSSNLTNYKNKIDVYYTKLYVMSFVYKNKDIHDLEIEDCYENFLKNNYLLEVLLHEKAKKSLDKFKSNMTFERVLIK